VLKKTTKLVVTKLAQLNNIYKPLYFICRKK